MLFRPKQLNCYDVEMFELIWDKLKEWRTSDSQPRVVLMQGSGSKAFCAGGDVRSVYEAGVNGIHPEIPRECCAKEYIVYYGLRQMDPIQIPVYNGVAMGGGIGKYHALIDFEDISKNS